MNFNENDLISLYLSELELVEECSSKQKIQLYCHKQLGKVLIINDEIQHIENYQVFYHELLVHLPIAFIPIVKDVLIIGGGSLFAAHEVLKYPTIKSVTLCDYDHNVLDIMERHYQHAKEVRTDIRFKYIEQDALDFFNSNSNKYDLVINDCFNIIKESCDKKIPLYEQISNLCNKNGACVDIIYRHIFDTEITKKSLEVLNDQYHLALSLVSVPEYPGVLHLETIWGKNPNIFQNAKSTINQCQLKMIQSNNLQFEYYNPSFIPFYMYLPPYIRKKFNL